jgi:hypothetical protein
MEEVSDVLCIAQAGMFYGYYSETVVAYYITPYDILSFAKASSVFLAVLLTQWRFVLLYSDVSYM